MFNTKRMISLIISCVFVVQIITSTMFSSNNVEAALLDGGDEIIQSAETPEESKESTRKGDVDGNGEVNSIDFARMRMKLLGMITSFPVSNGSWAADVSGDGKFNSIDFAYMRQYLLAIITRFPADVSDITQNPSISVTPTPVISEIPTPTDAEPPSKPVGLNYSSVASNIVSLYWEPSIDSDVKDYVIYKDDEFEALTNGATEYDVKGLLPNETYEFKVCAIDTSNNKSEFSDTCVVTTKVSNMEELKMALIRNFYDKGTTYCLTYDGDMTDLQAKVDQAILDAVNESNEPFMLLGGLSWEASGYSGNLQITFTFPYDDTNQYMIVARSTDEFKRALLCGFYNRNQNINIIYKGTITENDIREAKNSILSDDTYLNACIDNCDCTVVLNQSMGITAIRFNCNYKTTKEQEEYIDSTVEFIVSKLTNTDMTDDEKEKLIHDYILTNVDYLEDDIYGNPYSALCYGKTKCDGYAMLTYKMLKAAGIENIIVTNENHAWNLAKINGKWYHLDTTWDDSRNKNDGFYKYYNLTDTEILMSRNYSNVYGIECASNYIADLDERNNDNGGKYGEILKEIQQNKEHVYVNSFKSNASLNLLYNEVVLKEGENISLVDHEIPKELYENSYQWSSSNPDVATVDNGVITAKKAGTVMISAQLMYGMFSTPSLLCKVHVMAVESGNGKTLQVLSQGNISGFTDKSVQLKVTINSQGDINGTTTLTNATDLLSGKIGFIGEPINVTTTSEFNWAEIGFKLSEEHLANIDIKDLVIYWYDDKTGTIVPQATMVDEVNGVISATVNHFSTYFIASKQVQNMTATIAFVVDSKYSNQASLNIFKTNIFNAICELRKKSNVRAVFIDAKTNARIYGFYVPAEGVYTGASINPFSDVNFAFNQISPGGLTPSDEEIIGTVSSGMASGSEEISDYNISGVKNSKYVLVYTRWNACFVDNDDIQIKMGDTIGLIVGKTVAYYAGGAISYDQSDIIPLVEFLQEGNYTQITSSSTNKIPWVLKQGGNNIENDVIVLQKTLVALGLLEMPLDPNTNTYVPFGIYSGLTEVAVKKFQKNNGLDQDGKVGKVTWNRLNLPWDEKSAQPDRKSWSYTYILQNEKFFVAKPQVTLITPTKETKIKAGELLKITAKGTNCHHLAVFINGEWKLTVYGGSNTTTINLEYDYVIPEMGVYTIQVKGRNVPGSSGGVLACSEIVEVSQTTGTKFTMEYDGITYHYDAEPKHSKLILDALLNDHPVYLANKESYMEEPRHVVEKYYNREGPGWVIVLTNLLKDETIKYEEGRYTKEEYLSKTNILRDYLKCSSEGYASLFQKYLARSPYDRGWERFFIDFYFRVVCSDESYENGNTSNEVQLLIASINGYRNLPLYEFERTMNLAMVASSFLSAVQNVSYSIGSSANAAQRKALADQMTKYKGAVSQAEKKAILSKITSILKSAVEAVEKDTNIATKLEQIGDSLDDIIWRGTRVVNGETIIDDIGAFGEHIAESMLAQSGWKNFKYIKNGSDNGIDIIAQAADGHWGFFEVKTSSLGKIPSLSPRQANMDDFVNDILYNAKEGLGRYQNIDSGTKEIAEMLYNAYKKNPYDFSGNVIGVDIESGLIRVSRWER